MKSLRKIKTFQLRIYQKTANNSKSISNVKKLLTGINAKINELSCDILTVAEHLVFEEIFANYSMGTRALHGSPMGDPFGILQISLLKPNTQ
jgi:hypothetical protein